MEWSDDAIVLSVRAHGETSAIVETLTRHHGRHSGLVRGGASRRARAVLQPGNTLHAQWRARLSEHLGNFTLDLAAARAGTMMDSRTSLIGLNAFTGVASAALPEREPHASVFLGAEILLDAMMEDGFDHWAPLFVRWETGLLNDLGFGLDLSRCAVTGSVDDLLYVSPKSGRAVSRAAGEGYKSRLFALPPFLLGSQNASPDMADIAAGLKLTEHFLLERVFRPQGRVMPAARLRLNALAAHESE
jgi:DNA repair protein RecO (recombination protein O)